MQKMYWSQDLCSAHVKESCVCVCVCVCVCLCLYDSCSMTTYSSCWNAFECSTPLSSVSADTANTGTHAAHLCMFNTSIIVHTQIWSGLLQLMPHSDLLEPQNWRDITRLTSIDASGLLPRYKSIANIGRITDIEQGNLL